MNILFIILLFASFGFSAEVTIKNGGAGSVSVIGGGNGTITTFMNPAGGTSYSDITFYDAMDSITASRAPTKGNGILTFSDTIAVGAAMGGSSTASLEGTTNAQFKRITATSTANISLSEGRAGFYFSWDTATNDGSCAFGWMKSGDAAPRFAFRKGPAASDWVFKYEDVTLTKSITAGTTVYVEIAWDHNKTDSYCARLRLDNGAWEESNACTSGVPTNALNSFGMLGDSIEDGGQSVDGRMDEVLISSDRARDLYAIRNLGSYPD